MPTRQDGVENRDKVYLAKEIHSSVSHRSFLSGHFCQSVFFDPVTPNELLEISKAFRPGKAAGHDRIPISIIKKSIQIIAVPLAHIINLSISHVPVEQTSVNFLSVSKDLLIITL